MSDRPAWPRCLTSPTPTIGDAKHRRRVLTPNGMIGTLIHVRLDDGRAKVHVPGRHLFWPVVELLLVDFAGDVRGDRDQLIVCGPCGAVDADAHDVKCPRRVSERR